MFEEKLLHDAVRSGKRAGKPTIVDRSGKLTHPLWIQRVEYSQNAYPTHDTQTFSVTFMEKSIKERTFSRFVDHYVDVNDMGSIELGNAWHTRSEIVAKMFPDRYVAEQRVKILLVPAHTDELGRFIPDLYISGAIDLLDKKLHAIIDHKTTKSYTFKMNVNGREDDWKKQTAMYKWMAKEGLGFDATGGVQIHAEIVDFSSRNAGFNGNPESPCVELHYNITDKYMNDVVEWYRQEIERQYCIEQGWGIIPDCTPEECFRADEIKIAKKMNVDTANTDPTFRWSAVVGHADEPDWETACASLRVVQADANAKATPKKPAQQYRIYRKFTGATKCERYCAFRDVCEQAKYELAHPSFVEDITDGDIPF